MNSKSIKKESVHKIPSYDDGHATTAPLSKFAGYRSAPHRLPADLQKVITSSPAVKSAWEDITPLARNEWICWVITVKKPETRKLHIERARRELMEGKRRPCCWAGCMHR